MDELEPGAILNGRYCVERLVAHGGMSRLYQGHPLDGAGRVAIKQLDVPENGTVAREDLAQFRQEHEILQSLDHPGLARALDFFQENGRHYLVEEFVPGETLEAHLHRRGRLPCEEAVQIMDPILLTLQHLHEHGVIYRDLKPQNVILQPRPSDDGDESPSGSLPYTVRLVDFGAARRWKQGATRDTVPLGTPGFAPPEQYGKAQSDARSDVYGAGVLLHCMLTGCLPDPAQGWIRDAPHWTVPGVPPKLGQAVLKAVQVEPAGRFQDAAEMRMALLRAAGRIQQCPRCGTDLSPDGPACGECFARSTRVACKCIVYAVCVIVLASGGLANFFATPRQHNLDRCRHNLTFLATTLESYASKHGGRFPRMLSEVWQNRPEDIPTCPSVGLNTYSVGYASASSPAAYTLVCHGGNHGTAGQAPNFPQYTSQGGLIVQ